MPPRSTTDKSPEHKRTKPKQSKSNTQTNTQSKEPLLTNNTVTRSNIQQQPQPQIPIEQVIYLNDNKVVSHQNGTNRYYINYPDTWRTISNQQLLLGVRAIRKYGISTYDLQMRLQYIIDETSDGVVYTFYFSRRVLTDEWFGVEKQNILLDELNSHWEKYINELAEKDKERLADVINKRWTLTFNKDTEEYGYRCPFPINYDEFTVKHDVNVYLDNMSSDLRLLAPYTTVESILNPLTFNYCRCITLWFRKDTFRDTRQQYLLAASFVTQTNYQYLGFTNTEFFPPKQYIIPNGETRFWIDVVTADGRDTHELSNDGRDLIAVELTLTTLPYK